MNTADILTDWLREGHPPQGVQDIDQLLRAAKHERVHALLISDSIRYAEAAGVPGSVIDDLSADRRELAMKEAVLSRELARTLNHLAEHRIHPVILKGRALGLTHYDEPWHRPHSDVDLFVAPDDVEHVHRLLPHLGYSMPHGVRGLATSHQFLYAKPLQLGATLNLDVHWKLSNRHYFAHAISYAAAIATATRMERDGASHLVIGPSHALLHAAIHLKAHHHDTHQPLLWFYDMHLLLGRMSDAELQRTIAMAQTVGAVSALRDAVNATADRFQTNVTQQIIESLQALPDDESSSFDSISRLGEIRSDLLSMRSNRLRARYVRELVLPPSHQLLRRYGYASRAMLPVAIARRSVEAAWSALGTARKGNNSG